MADDSEMPTSKTQVARIERPVPEGERFTFLYRERGAAVSDSDRFRRRLSVYISKNLWDQRSEVIQLVGSELGAKVPVRYGHASIEQFIEECPLDDLLDCITIVAKGLKQARCDFKIDPWLQFVARAMREQNLGYRVDAKGGVHLSVDPIFQADLAAAIASLSTQKFSKVLEIFEGALRSLDGAEPSGKEAIAKTFEAAETLVKIVASGRVARLEPDVVERIIKPEIGNKIGNNGPALDAAKLALNAFKDWIPACHHYRHGQDGSAPIEPPLDLAIYLLSSGASHIRWLAVMFK